MKSSIVRILRVVWVVIANPITAWLLLVDSEHNIWYLFRCGIAAILIAGMVAELFARYRYSKWLNTIPFAILFIASIYRLGLAYFQLAGYDPEAGLWLLLLTIASGAAFGTTTLLYVLSRWSERPSLAS